MTILCYGDSNTFGFDPRSFLGGRYAPDCRWVDILAAETGWNVHNNSMNGRQIPRQEVSFSGSVDLLILMLGTNDLLQGATAEETTRRMGDFLGKLSIDSRKILLIAPPPLKRGEWVSDDQLVRESLALCSLYRHLAEEKNILFADAGEWNVPLAFDGVHITEEGNRIFAENLLRRIKMYIIQEKCI